MEAPEMKLATVPLPEDDFIKYNFKYNTPLCFYLNKYSPAACNLKVIDELFANGCIVYEECLYDASVPGHEWRISVIKKLLENGAIVDVFKYSELFGELLSPLACSVEFGFMI